MSHLPLRKEKICLNCGAHLISRYCQECGQENVEPRENAWHLIVHFFNDVTHFDGKFFSSLKHLLIRPGFLTGEYIKGRRARYLNPIRMYLFISAVFFLLYSSFFVGKEKSKERSASSVTKSSNAQKRSGIPTGVKNVIVDLDTMATEGDNDPIPLKNGDTITQKEFYQFTPGDIKSYDSLQNLLPPSEQHGKISRYFNHKMILVNQYTKTNKDEAWHRIRANFFHSMPYMLFISLPILALLLKLLYIRRKQYYYVAHSIFIIHFFSFLFIAILLVSVLRSLGSWGNTSAQIVVIAGIFAYLYIAMYRFYKQGWFKTLMKYILFNTVSTIFFVMLFAGLLFSSIMSLV